MNDYERDISAKSWIMSERRMMPTFVPFAEVLSHLKRGEWVYALIPEKVEFTDWGIVFGSIQAINFSSKALLIGVDVAPGYLVWVPEWCIFSTGEQLIKYCLGGYANSKELECFEKFIKNNESKDWVQSLRKND